MTTTPIILTPETPAPPTCAYADQCRAARIEEWAAHPELIAMMPAYCALLHKRDVREWQIRDCQRAMGFEERVKREEAAAND